MQSSQYLANVWKWLFWEVLNSFVFKFSTIYVKFGSNELTFL